MATKIYPTANNGLKFDYESGAYVIVPAGTMSVTNIDGRIAFHRVDSGIMFANYGLSEIEDEIGVAFLSFDALVSYIINCTAIGNVHRNFTDIANTIDYSMSPNQVFTGEWVDTLDYGTIIIGSYSSQNTAVNGVEIQYSPDRINSYQKDSFTLFSGLGKTFSFGMSNRYYRLVVTNGTLQSHVSIQCVLKNSPIKDSSHRISESIVGDDDATLTKSIITGLRNDGTFGNAVLDNENRLQVSSQPYLYGISEGIIPGHYSVIKCGVRTATAANIYSTVWEGITDTYQYPTIAEQLRIVSSSALDYSLGSGARTVFVKGLNASWNEVEEVVVLSGVTAVYTTNSYIRIFEMVVNTAGTGLANAGDVSAYNNAGTILLRIIKTGQSASSAAMWSVPAGKVAYITKISASSDTAKGARFTLLTRKIDGATLYPLTSLYTAFSVGGNTMAPFDVPFKIGEKTDIGIRVSTPANAGVTSNGATIELWYENL